MNFPSVTKDSAKGFAKVWNKGGIAIILDDTAIQFAADFANVALRSFIEGQMQIAAAKAKAAEEQKQNSKPTNAVSTQTVPATKPSGIILTD